MKRTSLQASVEAFVVRNPTVADGAAIWELVDEIEGLERNTCYAYLLLSTHFSRTCLVAERARELVGFVAAYRPPTRPDTVFVWQIGVRRDARGNGLAKGLLHRLMDLPACRDVEYLEATVTSSNEPSQRLFHGFARERRVACKVGRGFDRVDFRPREHEPENLFRIGPIRRD